mgnify:FL=1
MTAARNRPSPTVPLGPGSRVAIIAGSGMLPHSVAEALCAMGHRPLVVAIEGEAQFERAPERYDLWSIKLEHVGTLLLKLKRQGVTHLVMAGGVKRRPPIRSLRMTPGVLLFLPKLLWAYARGDDDLLSTLIRYVESHGIHVVGAHEVAPELLAPNQVLTKAKPTAADEKDISAALEAARAIGRLDIGQAAIAIGGRAIALEGIEGTDGLLARTIELRSHGRLAGKTRGVLVKCAKPGQETRADLPAIGPQTVRDAHAAGLAGIAVEAGRSFILETGETIRLADELGLFIIGYEKGREK